MHVLSGEIRKAPYTKEGSNSKGKWKMYGIELSERVRSRDGETTYTNYRATLFANENQIPYYDEWLSQWRFVTITSAQLTTRTFETENGVSVSLEMVEPRLHTFQSGGNAQPQQSQPKQSQPKQSKPSGNNAPSGEETNFDDDIPF